MVKPNRDRVLRILERENFKHQASSTQDIPSLFFSKDDKTLSATVYSDINFLKSSYR